MFRYGVNNFTRNAWLTIAATAVMTITLLIIFTTVAAHNILTDLVKDIGKSVDMSIYLKTDTTADQVSEVMDELRQTENVEKVSFVSSEQARKQITEENKKDVEFLNALNDATNKLPATIRVSLKDINDTSQLVNYVENSEKLKAHLHPTTKPSFLGDKKDPIKEIAGWTVLAQKIGLTASVVFIAISFLIIFNTIRMAIFSRKDEIHMMKLIGANKQFIRGPFIVEAVVYGFISAIIATALGVGLLYLLNNDKLIEFGLDITSTLDMATKYLSFVSLAMIIIGVIIGATSSWLATRRYLKV